MRSHKKLRLIKNSIDESLNDLWRKQNDIRLIALSINKVSPEITVKELEDLRRGLVEIHDSIGIISSTIIRAPLHRRIKYLWYRIKVHFGWKPKWIRQIESQKLRPDRLIMSPDTVNDLIRFTSEDE